SFAAMNDVMRRVEGDVQTVRGVRTTLATVGGSFLGSVNGGDIYVRIAPHEERYFSFGRLWRDLIHGKPMEAFRGNYTQRDVMQEIRAKMRKYPDLRVSVRNNQTIVIGGGNADLDF